MHCLRMYVHHFKVTHAYSAARPGGKSLRTKSIGTRGGWPGINSRKSCIAIYTRKCIERRLSCARGDAFSGNAIHVASVQHAGRSEGTGKVFSSAVPRVFLRQVYRAAQRMWICAPAAISYDYHMFVTAYRRLTDTQTRFSRANKIYRV